MSASKTVIDSAQARRLGVGSYVYARLKELGMGEIELHRSEARLLATIIKPDEYLGGVVCGHNENGHIMLAATDRRVLIIDAKPIYNNIEDITYRVVAGVSMRRSRLVQKVILHTRLGDFTVQTMNATAANGFKDYINQRSIEKNGGE